ncbi:MAG TPA: hypothetical protein VF857_02800, partial [Spirochaetota bacterium]
GVALIVTPTDNHLSNTESLFKKLSIPFASQKKENEPLVTPYLSPYDEIFRSSAFDWNIPYSSEIRKGSSAKNKVFDSPSFVPIFKDSHGDPILLSLHRKEWRTGQIIWLNGVLPGFNGEEKDPEFPEPYLRTLARKYKLSTEVWDSLKGKIESKFGAASGLEGSPIPDQGNREKISSGFLLLDSLLSNAAQEDRRIVFFDYLREQSDMTEVLSLLSSGALYAVIIVTILVFAGLLLFVREKAPLNALRENKASQRPEPYPPSETDPPVSRQGRARFAAQFIHIESELKKLPKE